MTDRIRWFGAAMLAAAALLAVGLWLVAGATSPRSAGLPAPLLLFATCFAAWNGAVLWLGGAALFGPAAESGRLPAGRAAASAGEAPTSAEPAAPAALPCSQRLDGLARRP